MSCTSTSTCCTSPSSRTSPPDGQHAARAARPEGPAPVFTPARQYPLVSISNEQRRPLPGANWVGTVYHGVPEALSTAAPDRRAISPSSAASRRRRDRIAPSRSPAPGPSAEDRRQGGRADLDYFRAKIEPLLDHPLIEFVGEIGDSQKSDFLGGAIGPGLPDRLAGAVRPGDDRGDGLRHAGHRLRSGSVPELVEDGLTGFIVEDETSAVGVVGRLAGPTAVPSESSSSNASPRGGWRSTISPPTAA